MTTLSHATREDEHAGEPLIHQIFRSPIWDVQVIPGGSLGQAARYVLNLNNSSTLFIPSPGFSRFEPNLTSRFESGIPYPPLAFGFDLPHKLHFGFQKYTAHADRGIPGIMVKKIFYTHVTKRPTNLTIGYTTRNAAIYSTLHNLNPLTPNQADPSLLITPPFPIHSLWLHLSRERREDSVCLVAMAMAKFVAFMLMAMFALSMLQSTLVMASNTQRRGGAYGEGSVKSYQCPGKCGDRCKLVGHHHEACMFFCQKCCKKCLCVPKGTSGNKASCACYNNWKTKRGGPKCP